jgi:hypothetical protein
MQAATFLVAGNDPVGPAMIAEILVEPELEFGGGGRHVDPRFGISNYGPADLDEPDRHRPVRVGLVGPADLLPELRAWLERCRDPIAAKDDSYPNLFTSFPGCDVDRGLLTTLVLSDRTTAIVSNASLREIAKAPRAQALSLAVEAYAQEARMLAEQNRVDVLLVARPPELADTRHRRRGKSTATDASQLSKTNAGTLLGHAAHPFANFHDLLKAELLGLSTPIQIIRRSTWDEATAPPAKSGRQDEATRAWNLHVALHYKAGGVPWRLQRDSHELTTCFIGVSFYRSSTQETLETAVAQVFNERGDGVIVRGGPARMRSNDRQPHLTGEAARDLLIQALDAYRGVHKNLPARIVIHKASSFTPEEESGFRDAAKSRSVDELDLTWVTLSEEMRLFRPGAAPPLRGTHVVLDASTSVLYTKGSVDFYSTYPGAYVPQPIGLRHLDASRSPTSLAEEVLALTKMNWNQTRLDGLLPVTLRTANQVKQLLRFCEPESIVAMRYAHYM